MQGWGWEGSGRVVGALFVERASGFVSKEVCRESGKGSFLQRRVSSMWEPTMSVKYVCGDEPWSDYCLPTSGIYHPTRNYAFFRC